MNTKISEQHHRKPAYIYVRQSTLAQVRHHRESTERQYALREKALALGWPDTAIRTLDRDLGLSGAQMSGREDFKTLVADVSMGQVGAVFATKDCLSVRADLLDDAIGEELFKALRPAEIELALAALSELEQRDQALMHQWQMRIERAEYEAALAERRYEEADPSNRLVTATLERRWNEALVRLEQIRAEAAQFQSRKARVATPEQKAKALALARDLPRLWRASTTQAKDRKRMLRLLIRDITVEKLPAQRQVILHVRWQGGACTDTTVSLPAPIAERIRYPAAIVEQVRELSHHLSDPQIVAHLNQQGLRSPHGKPFTLSMIKWLRYRYGIPSVSLKRPEELTVQQLAQRFGVSIHVVHYWIKRSVVEARQLDGRGPWWITLNAAKEQELRDWIRNSGHLQPDHSNTQL